MIAVIAAIAATDANAPAGALALVQKYLPYQVVGLLVVLLTLAGLSGICAFIGARFDAWARRQAGARAPGAAGKTTPAPAVAPVPLAGETTDPRVVAAIAAAITVALAQPNRIIEISAAGHPVSGTSAWAIEGRFQHFSSHKIR